MVLDLNEETCNLDKEDEGGVEFKETHSPINTTLFTTHQKFVCFFLLRLIKQTSDPIRVDNPPQRQSLDPVRGVGVNEGSSGDTPRDLPLHDGHQVA